MGTAPRHLIRDRDGAYGQSFRSTVTAMGVEEVVTAPRSPWQNPYVERLIGSVRRECLDHSIILNERHLRRILGSYLDYYHGSRTHLSLGKDTPDDDPLSRPGPERSFPCPRSAVCIIVTNALRPDHPRLGFDQFLSVATWTLPASACPCIGSLARSGGISIVMTAPMVDYKIHWLKMMSVPESRAVVGRARWNKWKGQVATAIVTGRLPVGIP